MVGFFFQRRSRTHSPSLLGNQKQLNTVVGSVGRASMLVAAILASFIAGIFATRMFFVNGSVSPSPILSCPLGCAPHPEAVLTQYSDLAYPIRTPDLAIDAIIRVYNTTTGKVSTHDANAMGAVSLSPAEQKCGEVRRSAARLLGIVLCHRRDKAGRLAIPGGFVEYGESIETAVRREVLEETHIDLSRSIDVTREPLRSVRRHQESSNGSVLCVSPTSASSSSSSSDHLLSTMEQFRVFSNPARDPRRHTVSAAFDVIAFNVIPRAADDVKECRIYSLNELRALLSDAAQRSEIAFDHAVVLDAYLEHVFFS
jgi:8-oxo-dGTP diphosphatase